MTREEQIIEAGIDYTMSVRPTCIGGINFEKEIKEFNRNKSFEEGAKWADKHPKKGLVSIDKACKWIEEYLFEVGGLPDEKSFLKILFPINEQ